MKRVIKVLLILIVVLAVGAGGVFWWWQRQKNMDEGEKLVAKVSKFMVLPDERVTLATIVDKERLKERSFFKNAENGDKVLIFPKAARAFLYRPSIGKIVDVTAIQTVEAEVAVTPELSPTPEVVAKKVSLTLYNGSGIAGITRTADQIILSEFPDFEIGVRANASKSDYEESLIVNLSGNNAEMISKVSDKFGFVVGTLPEGEIKPEGEVLIIFGKNYPQ